VNIKTIRVRVKVKPQAPERRQSEIEVCCERLHIPELQHDGHVAYAFCMPAQALSTAVAERFRLGAEFRDRDWRFFGTSEKLGGNSGLVEVDATPEPWR
jgi:hypothetical protein